VVRDRLERALSPQRLFVSLQILLSLMTLETKTLNSFIDVLRQGLTMLTAQADLELFIWPRRPETLDPPASVSQVYN
jgi:hypothetical protein